MDVRNICRCGANLNILDAIKEAAAKNFTLTQPTDAGAATRAKKAILQKKRILGSGSSERTISRQPFDVYEVSGRTPTAPVPDFVTPMPAMLVESIRPGDWLYEIKFDGRWRMTRIRTSWPTTRNRK